MHVLAVIPSRFESTRFPGKALADILGKPMIQRVYEQVSKSKDIDEIIVATDHQEILETVVGFGGNAILTSSNHKSGTERCAEILEQHTVKPDIIINVQGDEPIIDPAQIDLLVDLMRDPETDIGTLAVLLSDYETLTSPSQVKLVMDTYHNALLFSRSVIPHIRNLPREKWTGQAKFYGHVGMYGFKPNTLIDISKLQPSPLEIAESLEQLRWMENGYRIKVAITSHITEGVNTPEDLKRIIRLYPNRLSD